MDIRIPDLAESVKEGDLATWLKKDGDQVRKDEAILELETDKATVELAAEAAGTLEILVQATHAAAGGAAWGSALYAAGSTALRSWSRPGVWAAGRATLRLGGRWTAGGVIESREDGGRRGATAASFWIQRTLPAKAR